MARYVTRRRAQEIARERADGAPALESFGASGEITDRARLLEALDERLETLARRKIGLAGRTAYEVQQLRRHVAATTENRP